MRNETFRMLDVYGDTFGATAAGTTNDIKVLLRDASEKILIATGTEVPTDATAGYAKGCLYIDTDVATGSTGLYENVGTTTSCNFDQIGSNTTLAADSISGTQIADDAVSLEHLDSGIASGFIIPAAGEVTWTGSGATLASSVSGVLATDVAIGSIHTLGTQGTILQGTVASSGTITFTLDAANTSNDTVVSYMTLRAAT